MLPLNYLASEPPANERDTKRRKLVEAPSVFRGARKDRPGQLTKEVRQMKRLTCRDLGGPCEAELLADTFEEMSNISRQHVVEQIQAGDGDTRLLPTR